MVRRTYRLPIEIDASAGLAANGFLFALGITNAPVLTIRRIRLQLVHNPSAGLDGLISTVRLARYKTAHPTGGTDLSAKVVKNWPGQDASGIVTARVSNGATVLTAGAAVLEDPFAVLACPKGNTTLSNDLTGVGQSLDLFENNLEAEYSPLTISAYGANTLVGLAIAAGANVTDGIGIFGFVEWDER